MPMHAIGKLQHWRGSQGENALEGAPVLEFDNEPRLFAGS